MGGALSCRLCGEVEIIILDSDQTQWQVENPWIDYRGLKIRNQILQKHQVDLQLLSLSILGNSHVLDNIF